MPTPVRPMSATPAAVLPQGADWTYEVKWDGYRALIVSDGRRARVISRNLKDLTNAYPHLATAVLALTEQPVILDGEVVALDEHGKPSFQALQHRSVTRSGVVYYVFDLLQLGPVEYTSQALQDRRRALGRLRWAPPLILSMPLPGSPEQIARVIREAGLEGVVAKRAGSIYRPGIRTRDWIKVKFSPRQEFVIGGYRPAGRGFDSVLVGYFKGRRLFYAGKVRAGFTPRTRQDLWSRIAGRELAMCPFVNLPNSTGGSHWGEGITAEDMATLKWVSSEVVIDVTFTEWTAGGNLRHAAFAGIRDDKAARRVTRED